MLLKTRAAFSQTLKSNTRTRLLLCERSNGNRENRYEHKSSTISTFAARKVAVTTNGKTEEEKSNSRRTKNVFGANKRRDGR